MRTEEEIKNRIRVLSNELNEIRKSNYGLIVPDWNERQFEIAISYLNWVLESEEK